jgi:hypothetical protein
MSFLAATAAAPQITVELSDATTVVLAIIAALLGVIAWFLRRELKNNDAAHRDLGTRVDGVAKDVKTLLHQIGFMAGKAGAPPPPSL